MFQLVVIQNGQYGFVHKENEKLALDQPFETIEQAKAAASRRYYMLANNPGPNDTLEGTPDDFTITVASGDYASFSDHYFIEEV